MIDQGDGQTFDIDSSKSLKKYIGSPLAAKGIIKRNVSGVIDTR